MACHELCSWAGPRLGRKPSHLSSAPRRQSDSGASNWAEAPSVGRGSKSSPGSKSFACHVTHWGLWPFLRGRPRVRISPVSLAPKPGDFCLIFDAILTPKTNYGPITLTQRGWGYLKWPQLPGASLRAVISGAWGGEGARTGGTPGMRLPLLPCLPWQEGTSHPALSHTIPSYSLWPSPAPPLGSAEAKQRWGSLPPWCPGWGLPCPLPPPALCHRLGPAQRGPVTGGSSPGPGRDLRDDLE